MSYILDALRRADTERGRDVVPGIHSQMDGPGADRVVPSRNRTLLWAVAGLSAALVLVIAWLMLRGGDAPPVVASTPAPVETAPPMAPPAPEPTPAPATIVSTTTPPVIAASPQHTARALPREDAPATRHQRAEQAPSPSPTQSNTAVATAPKPAASTPAASPAATGNARIHTLNELPQDIRGSLPQLSIGGAMYSPNPASRMLIVNGQLMHEGDKVTPELVLDEIGLKRAVLSFRGYRYSINY